MVLFFLAVAHNGPPAAASAGFTRKMISFPISLSGLLNACLRKSPALLAAGLLAAVIF